MRKQLSRLLAVLAGLSLTLLVTLGTGALLSRESHRAHSAASQSHELQSIDAKSLAAAGLILTAPSSSSNKIDRSEAETAAQSTFKSPGFEVVESVLAHVDDPGMASRGAGRDLWAVSMTLPGGGVEHKGPYQETTQRLSWMLVFVDPQTGIVLYSAQGEKVS